jgi:UDP-glucose:(heptosyl)LPS alpha-1,3-glucosyltransferase
MACGLPVVVSRQTGTAEIVEEGVDGFTCDALDHRALARHMETLCDSGRARKMGEAARRTAEGFTLERMKGALRELYEALL